MLGVDETARGGAHGTHDEREREPRRGDAAQLEQGLRLPAQHSLALEDVRRAHAGRRDAGHGCERRLVFPREGTATGLVHLVRVRAWARVRGRGRVLTGLVHHLHGAEGRAA